MRNTGRKVFTTHSPLVAAGTGGAPPPGPETHYMDWYNNRRGYGATCDAGFGSGWTTYTVTDASDANTGSGTSGTLRYCLSIVGNTIVKFAAGLGSIVDVNKTGYPTTSNTLIDGYGYTGTIFGEINTSNCDNVVVMYMSCTQPFKYNANPSGGVFTSSNCPRFYIYRCTGWDTGDGLFDAGAYQLSPGGSLDKPQPYYATVDQCLFGPNPGVYAMMAPIMGGPFTSRGAWVPNTAYVKQSSVTYGGVTWYAPKAVAATTFPPPFGGWGAQGYPNGIDNDARNGKGVSIAYDHGAVAAGRALSDFDHVAYITVIENVLQGNQIRNGKARDETMDFVNNVVAKFGTSQDLGGPGIHSGAGTALDDSGTMNIEGNVYISYEDGEQFLGFMDSVADAQAAANPTLGITHLRVVVPRSRNKVITVEGKAATLGNAYIANNWLDGLTPGTPKYTTGFTRPYSIGTIPDRSIYANAQALVHKLCDDPATKVGNPWSTLQPPYWRQVHTGSTFPVTP